MNGTPSFIPQVLNRIEVRSAGWPFNSCSQSQLIMHVNVRPEETPAEIKHLLQLRKTTDSNIDNSVIDEGLKCCTIPVIIKTI